MRLHGLPLARLKQSLLLSPHCLPRASFSSHFCSAPADDKLGSSGAANSKAKGVRSRKAPSLSDLTDFSSAASKPVRSKHLERSNVIATTSCIKPKRLKGAPSEIEFAHNPRIEEDPLGAAKLKGQRRGLLAEILENGDDTNDLSVSAKMVVPAKKVSKCASVEAQGLCTITREEITRKSETRLPTGHSDVEVSAHPPTRDKPSRKSSKIFAKETIGEDHDRASLTPMKESKKSSVLVAFSIDTLSRWWISCYMNSSVDVMDLTDPLTKPHLWVTAYQIAFSRMTGKYCDGEAICNVFERLHDLQLTVASNTFKWADEDCIYLASPSTESVKTAKASKAFVASAFQDHVVEEVLLLVLEPIFEARFSARSHAFRPGRDAHTAIHMVRKSFQGCVWFLSGNISSLKVYSSHVLKSVVSKVGDRSVCYLLESGIFREKWVGMNMEEVDKPSMRSNRDLSTRLKFLLLNAFLDQLDQWADSRIHILFEREHLSFRSSSNLFFRSATSTTKKTPKMEYVRYGTNFLVGFRGSQKEAETLREGLLGFLNTNMGVSLNRNQLPLHHISDGVKFLDHIISQKTVHPILHRRSASNGKTFEKRVMRIRLCLKASRESCVSYLNQIGSLASFEEMKTILLVLNNWYRYAEDKVKMIDYCKLCLCNLYLRKVSGERYNLEMSKASLKRITKTLEDSVIGMDHGSDGAKCTSKGRVWLGEHEENLKELAWLQNEEAMQQVVKEFRHMSTLSLQQRSAQVIWDFSKGSYPLKGDYFWEAETWMHSPAGVKEGCLMDSSKSEELSECAA